jgi:hypothetical protein
MRTRLGIALSLGAALAALTFALSATASPLPAQPAPIGDPCLTVTVAPHVVSVGGNVIARTGPGTGGCTHPRVEWSWFVNGEKSTTCGTSSSSCEIKATRPTDGYRPICAVGTGASAGVQACDYVAVTASGTYTVSGHLTARSAQIKRLSASTPELANVANAKVEAVGPDGESTVTRTAADGSYSLSVPRGRYTITVEPDAGADYVGATTPGAREVIVAGDLQHIDFALGQTLHLKGELIGFRPERHHLLGLRMSFLQNGKLVGSANNVICTAIVCAGRATIGSIGEVWFREEWPLVAHAERGTGVLTSEKVARDENGGPNFPSAANQYEGTISAHTSLQFGSLLHKPFAITIVLI